MVQNTPNNATHKSYKSFTTEPKTRRHGQFTSGVRCRQFMWHMWEKKLRKIVSPTTLKLEFTLCFGTNDVRTVRKYIGRPKMVIRKGGKSMVRMNRQTGTTSQFMYGYTQRVTKINGLMEVLGYLSWDETRHVYRLNHELLPYFTEQVELEVPPRTPLLESVREECLPVDGVRSIDNTCARSGVRRGMVADGEAKENKTTEREERESITYTHANRVASPNILAEDSP